MALLCDELRVLISYRLAASSSPAPLYTGVVDVECPTTMRHLREVFRARPWWRVGPSPHGSPAPPVPLQLCEYEALDWDAVMSRRVVTNNFMLRKGLCRKANFARVVQRHMARCAGGCPLAGSVPPTAVIDTMPVFHGRPVWLDLRAALADALCEAAELMEAGGAGPDASAPAFVLKPSLGNKGAEIHFVRTLEEVEAVVCEWRDVGQWVLQRYVARPLLLGGGRKFHIRLYVLADGALDVWVFSEALVLLAAQPWAPLGAPGGGDVRFAHLTNTCVGAEAPGFDESACVFALSELPGLLQAAGAVNSSEEAAARLQRLSADMRDCVRHTFTALEGGEMAGFAPLPNAWELYGLDFLVDEDWRVHLLEANPTPDIAQTRSRLDAIVGDLLEGVARIAIDGRFPPPAKAPAPQERTRKWDRVYTKQWVTR